MFTDKHAILSSVSVALYGDCQISVCQVV